MTDFSLDIHAVLNNLPHRYPFLLVDRILEVMPGDRLRALKNVSINEPYFVGHFPEQPVMPGVLILEALAQAGALLAAHTLKEATELGTPGHLFLLAGLEDVRYKQVVLPGDQLILEVSLLSRRQHFWKILAKAMVADKIVCSAKIISAIKKKGNRT